MSIFDEVKLGPPIEAFIPHINFYQDTSDNKINLAIGGYRTEEGKPWVLPVVRSTEKTIAQDDSLNKDYFQITDYALFDNLTMKLLLGEDSPAIKENRAYGKQTVSGTGAFRVGAEFLSNVLGKKIFYCSNPTWGSHKLIFKNAGFQEGREYRYWSPSKRGLDFEGLIEDLSQAPVHSVIILQASGHNPTGCDPTEDQWKQIAEVMKERRLFPFFDSSLQGLVSSDLDKDAFSIRLFVSLGMELFCAQTFSKNFGLYNERVGSLVIVANDSKLVDPIDAAVRKTTRGMFIVSPIHGNRIITGVLLNQELFKQWQDHLKVMTSRITKARKQLREALERLGTPGDWSHITQQIGLSAYTGLNAVHAEHLAKKHHMHMARSGRISICAITPSNIEHIAKAIHETVISCGS